jgi:hypothetical protein
LGAKSRVAETAVEEPVNALTGGGFASKPSGDDVEFILVNEVGDTWKAYAGDLRGSIEKIRGNMLKSEELSEVVTTDRVKLS